MKLRYVILRHEGVDMPHFDLMFETRPGSPLATWRSEIWPIVGPTALTRLGEHRREYLEYEGPVSGDRGFVTRVAAGVCEISITADQWRIESVPPREFATFLMKPAKDDQWHGSPEHGPT